METAVNIITTINDIFWDYPLPIILCCIGVFTMIGFRGKMTFSLKTLWENTLGSMFKKSSNVNGKGTISSFAAAMSAMGGTVGVGNISGVASAIVAGGPGAVFWMWVSGILGMSTKAAEIIIGQRYRVKYKKTQDEYICTRDFATAKALGWKIPAMFFAASAVITQPWNAIAQTNAISESINQAFNVPKMVSVVIMCGILLLIIVGGVRRIAEVAEKVVPAMCVFYIATCLILVIINFKTVPTVFAQIFKCAFTGKAAVGGAVGYSVQQAVRFGIARGLYSNDSGIGASLCSHAPAITDHPGRQAAWGWGENFVDTIIVCTLTALALLCTNVHETMPEVSSAGLATAAFTQTYGSFGGIFIAIATTFLAFTTVMSNYYRNEKSLNFLIGDNKNLKWLIYVWMAYFIIPQFFGFLNADFIWAIADTSSILNILITAVLIIGTHKEVFRLGNDFFDRYNPLVKAGKNPEPVVYGDEPSDEIQSGDISC